MTMWISNQLQNLGFSLYTYYVVELLGDPNSDPVSKFARCGDRHAFLGAKYPLLEPISVAVNLVPLVSIGVME